MEIRGQLGTGSLHHADSRGHTQVVRCSAKWLNPLIPKTVVLCVCAHMHVHMCMQLYKV